MGLVIDEAYASDGHVLTNTFLGGLTSLDHENRRIRQVPQHGVPLVEAARFRGRGLLLNRMMYEPTTALWREPGLVLERPISPQAGEDQGQGVDGVVALYYEPAFGPRKMQFLPNPFSPRRVEATQNRLPWTLDPFDSGL